MRTVTLPLALAVGAIALTTSNVYAEELDKIVIDQPVVKVVGRDGGDDGGQAVGRGVFRDSPSRVAVNKRITQETPTLAIAGHTYIARGITKA